jgi:hypothetical protein
MPFTEGWPDQYERMLRSNARLAAASTLSNVGSDEARDMLFHFFQDAYHLKDWLKNDPALAMSKADKDALELHISATAPLARCADLCNGVKHLRLATPRVPGKPAELTNQSVSIQLGVGATHTWHLTFDGQKADTVQLADDTVLAWQDWLKAKGLMS